MQWIFLTKEKMILACVTELHSTTFYFLPEILITFHSTSTVTFYFITSDFALRDFSLHFISSV